MIRVVVRGSFLAILAFISWTGVASLQAQSVILELKNGDRLTGRILTENTNRVVLSNTWATEISIPLTDIARRVAVPVPTNAPAVVVKPAETNAPPTNAVALAKAVAATNTLFNVAWMRNWHGDIQAGVDLTFSERDRQVYHTKTKLTYAKNRLRNVIDYDFTYGRSETSDGEKLTDANRMNGSVKTDYDFTKKWFVYNLGGAGYDEIRKIDLRYEIGPGIGYHLIQGKNFFVNTEAGANYQVECRTDGSEIDTFFFRLAENISWKITPRLSWDEKFEYMPRVEDFSFYRLRFESNLRYALLQNVFLNIAVLDIYDSKPANRVTRNDLQIRSSVGVKF